MTTKKKKVVIVGFAPGRELAPYEDDSFEFWGMNDLWAHWAAHPGVNPKWDRWFDMHQDDVLKNNFRTGPHHIKWLKSREADFPIYMLKTQEDIPGSVPYPIDEIWKSVGDEGNPYFVSTPAYMMALALFEEFEEVHVYGINLLGLDEYEYQRPNFEYWIGLARGKGVKVVLPKESTICKASFKYGYETHGGQEKKPFLRLLDAKLIDQRKKHSECVMKMNQLSGSQEALQWVKDMATHDARGGFIPLPENVPPEAAHEQQKRDAAIRAMGHLREITAKAMSGDQEAIKLLPSVSALVLSTPDEWEKIEMIAGAKK